MYPHFKRQDFISLVLLGLVCRFIYLFMTLGIEPGPLHWDPPPAPFYVLFLRQGLSKSLSCPARARTCDLPASECWDHRQAPPHPAFARFTLPAYHLLENFLWCLHLAGVLGISLNSLNLPLSWILTIFSINIPSLFVSFANLRALWWQGAHLLSST